MGFGTSVATLLDTYAKCLDLLKGFKHGGNHGGKRTSHDVDADQQSLLRRSLRSGRAKIERSYSSTLSERGRRLEKGDAPARSALSRILKKLKAAIHNLVHRSDSPRLDYESLMALSNSSRSDAIRTIDQLSQRLASSSRGSVTSLSSKRLSSSQHRRHGSSNSVASSRSGEGRLRKASHELLKEDRSMGRKKLAKNDNKSSPSPRSNGSTNLRPTSGASKSTMQNRLSMTTMSSDSTRLGEVPERKRRLRPTTTDSSSDEYNVVPVYPLRPYHFTQPGVKVKRIWGLFRRRDLRM